MTINEYQKAALRTAVYDDLDGLLVNGAMGLCGESGEVIDIVKKFIFQKHPFNAETEAKLIEELGDVAWYLAVTAHSIGVDLESVLQYNVDKLRKRYPDGFDPMRSIRREE